MTLSACLSATNTPPQRIEAPVIDVMRRARNLNWLVRVHADSVYEGRVTFVHPDAARVGRQLVAFDRVTQVDRSYESETSGKTTGLVIGAGIGLSIAYLLSAFAAGMGDEVGIGAIAAVGLVAVIGAISGSGIDPPAREWATIWQR
jgi:hypothetical protein